MQLFFLFVAIVLAADLSAAGTGPAARAEALLELARTSRDAAQRDSVCVALEALSDTLAAAEDHVTAARALDQAGILAFRAGDLPRAQQHWMRGLELARRSGDRPVEASLLNSRAIGVSAGGDLEAGAASFEELAGLRRELGDVRGEGITLTNLARAWLQLFRLPEADAALQRALECHRESGNLNGLSQSYQQRAQILLELQDADAALAMADSAVAVARRGASPRALAVACADRGWIRQQAGDPSGGLEDLDEGLALLAGLDDPVLAENPRINRGVCLVELGSHAEAITEFESVEAGREGRGDDRGVILVRAIRGFALVEAGRLEDARVVLERTIAALEALRAGLDDEASRVAAFRIGGQAYADLARCHLGLGDPRSAWEVSESGRASRLRSQLSPGGAIVSLDSLQTELARVDAQLLHYADLTGDVRTAFVVRPDTLIARIVPMPATLGADLELAGYLIGSGAGDEMVQPVLDRIGAGLVGPISDALDVARGRLLVSLPKGFAGLPFEALPMPGGMPLIDQWLVSEVPSATVFTQLQRREAAAGPPLAFADPAIEEARDEEVVLAERFRGAARSPLPMSRREAGLVAGNDGVLAVGSDATRARLDEGMKNHPGVLHFATHAVVDPIRPEASALLLAGRGREVLLTASEVEGLDLPVDLVTLSGCRTADGLPVLGEGTLGLSRAFLLSGARSVVMSRWDVDDALAAEFMDRFYAELRRGRPRDEALRTAREQLRSSGRSFRDRAAFVLVGAPSGPVASIAGSSPMRVPSLPLLVGALVIVVVIGAALGRRGGSKVQLVR